MGPIPTSAIIKAVSKNLQVGQLTNGACPPDQIPIPAVGLIYYNGVILECTHVRAFRQAIYHGPDYLYTKHRLEIQAVYNPGLTAYQLPQQIGLTNGCFRPFPPVRFKDPTTLGSITDVAVRSFLMEPRRPLLWIMGTFPGHPFYGIVTLASPDPFGIGATVDSNNGPTPVDCNVLEIHGNKTFLVSFVIETYLNESMGVGTNGLSPLLSNRFSMTSELDEHFFTTRAVSGRAVFRTDVLGLMNARPDDFRDYLFFPVPLGFKRTNLKVETSPDGNAVQYSFVDQEQQLTIISQGFGVTKIEGTFEIGMKKDPIGNLGERIFRSAPEFTIGSRDLRDLSTTLGAMIGNALERLQEFKIDITGQIPQYGAVLDLKIFGSRQSNRFKLTKVATQILSNRLQALSNNQQYFATTHTRLQHDLMHKAIHATAEFQFGPTFGKDVGITIPANWLSFASFLGADAIPGVLDDSDQAISPNPPTGVNSSRGYYLGTLVSAALQPNYGMDQYGPRPPSNSNPPNYTDRRLP